MKRINLFVIGASKCGTTFLHDVLNMHSEICMSSPKEPFTFFGDDYINKVTQIEGLFQLHEAENILGESSPIYSETIQFPQIPERIHQYNPTAKIIYIVREPFSRLSSVYKQTMSTGHWVNKKSWGRYGDKMPIDFSEAVFSYPPFLDATKYWTHIQAYKEYFSDSAIKVIFFEDMVRNTDATVTSIFQFLGVDVSTKICIDNAKQNKGEGKTVFNPWASRLRKIAPTSLIKLAPSVVKSWVKQLTIKFPRPDIMPTVLTEEEKDRVRKILAPEVEGLYQYLNIKDDPWRFFDQESNR